MQPPSSARSPAPPAPEMELPWPCLPEGRKLFLLAAAPGGRGRSFGRFLGAAFLAFGLLLLLAGTQKNLPPALAGGSACIFSGLVLLCAVRRGAAPLLVLDGESGGAVLCRRRLGHRAFRLFAPGSLELLPAPDGKAVRIRPREGADAGREIPGLPSRIPDAQWRQGITLPTPDGDAVEAVSALDAWQSLAREGAAPVLAGACDRVEFAALLGKRLPPALLHSLSGTDDAGFREASGEEAEEVRVPVREATRPSLRAPTGPRPEIRRAPDLRDATGARDKRD